MESPAVTFTLAYLVFAVCFVFPPDEVRSAGLTVQSLLAAWLGSEDAAFVQYHLRRSTGTLLAHSLLPLGERRAGGWAAFLPRCGQRAPGTVRCCALSARVLSGIHAYLCRQHVELQRSNVLFNLEVQISFLW